MTEACRATWGELRTQEYKRTQRKKSRPVKTREDSGFRRTKKRRASTIILTAHPAQGPTGPRLFPACTRSRDGGKARTLAHTSKEATRGERRRINEPLHNACIHLIVPSTWDQNKQLPSYTTSPWKPLVNTHMETRCVGLEKTYFASPTCQLQWSRWMRAFVSSLWGFHVYCVCVCLCAQSAWPPLRLLERALSNTHFNGIFRGRQCKTTVCVCVFMRCEGA